VPRARARTPPRATGSRGVALRLFRGRQTAAAADFLLIGLGNPGSRYAGTRHNVGYEVAEELGRRWELPRARKQFNALITDGRAWPRGPRVALLLPQTFMNDSGRSAGPARGSLRLDLDHVVAIHDEIDLPFGEVQTRAGGGLAGHNGLKSLKQHLGGADFLRTRVGVGRPDSTDPDVVAGYVLSRFSEPRDDVAALIQRAADETERLVRERFEAEE
jgi:PTH1 family peptidyl-tRNA hydrolase